RRNGALISAIADDDRGVAQQAAALGARNRGAAEALAKRRVVEAEQLGRVDQLRLRVVVAIPGADFLTDIAAEEPVADAGAQLVGNRRAEFNREVADAAARVEHAGGGEGLRWASVEAGGTGAAVVGLVRRIRLQVEVRQQRAEEEVAAA